MNHSTSGFTLIELLVVIAIIALLASIVLTSLGVSRKKGNDSVVQADLNQLQQAMDIYNIDNNNYGAPYDSNFNPVCPTSGDPSIFDNNTAIQSSITALNKINGNLTKCAAGTLAASGNATSYAIASPVSYSTPATQWWCIDSTGHAKLSENNMNFFIKILATVFPAAYAFVQGPHIGGGVGTAAGCP
jgi:prepilin-type N-terminal cleavage/methylation domain-containing protein